MFNYAILVDKRFCILGGNARHNPMLKNVLYVVSKMTTILFCYDYDVFLLFPLVIIMFICSAQSLDERQTSEIKNIKYKHYYIPICIIKMHV